MKLGKLMAVLAAVLTLAGCKEALDKSRIRFTPGENPDQTALADMATTVDGGFSFYADDMWTAAVTGNAATKAGGSNEVWWLKLSIAGKETYSGSVGNYFMKIGLEPNYTGRARSARIVLTCAGEDIAVTVTQSALGEDGTVPVDPNPVELVVLDRSALSLSPGEHTTLEATVYPVSATYRSVSWRSADPSVAKVDAGGRVSALALGRTVIRAAADADESVWAECEVEVAYSDDPTGTGRFVYSNAGDAPLEIFYAFYRRRVEGDVTIFNVDFHRPEMAATDFSFEFRAAGIHSQLPEATYTFSEYGGAGTFYQRSGEIGGQTFYGHDNSTVTVTKTDGVYMIGVNMTVYRDEGWTVGRGTVQGSYTGTLRPAMD